MLKNLFVILTILASLVSHQLHIVCSDYAKDCPSLSELDIIAKIPFIKLVAIHFYNNTHISHKLLPIVAYIGKQGYYVLVLSFFYFIVFQFVKRIFSFIMYTLCICAFVYGFYLFNSTMNQEKNIADI